MKGFPWSQTETTNTEQTRSNAVLEIQVTLERCQENAKSLQREFRAADAFDDSYDQAHAFRSNPNSSQHEEAYDTNAVIDPFRKGRGCRMGYSLNS